MSVDWKLPKSESGVRADAADKPDRAALIAEATKHGVEVRPGMTDHALRTAVIEKLRPDHAAILSGRSEAQVSGVFNAVTYLSEIAARDAAAKAAAKDAALAAATLGGHVAGATHPAQRADAVHSTAELRASLAAAEAAERQGTAPRVVEVRSLAELRDFNRQNRS